MIQAIIDWWKHLWAAKPSPAVPAPPTEPLPIPSNTHKPYGDAPDYVQIALGFINWGESNHIDWVMGLFKFTTYAMKFVDKTTPWCAAWISMLMVRCGYKCPKSAAAKDQGKIGVQMPFDEPYGVCVWQHLTGGLKGHYHTNIALKVLTPGSKYLCIGGNQNNTTSTATYGLPDYKLVSYRKPVKG